MNTRALTYIVALGFVGASLVTAAPSSLQSIAIPVRSYLSSGLPNSFPVTYVFGKDGKLIFAAGASDGDALNSFFASNGAKTPSQSSELTTKSERFSKLLADNGQSLAKLVPTTKTFTVFNVEVGTSIGVCAPCTQRHKVIAEDVPPAFDAGFVIIHLEDT